MFGDVGGLVMKVESWLFAIAVSRKILVFELVSDPHRKKSKPTSLTTTATTIRDISE